MWVHIMIYGKCAIILNMNINHVFLVICVCVCVLATIKLLNMHAHACIHLYIHTYIQTHYPQNGKRILLDIFLFTTDSNKSIFDIDCEKIYCFHTNLSIRVRVCVRATTLPSELKDILLKMFSYQM